MYESLLMQQDHYVHLDSCLRAHFVVVALSVPADLRTRLLDPLQEVLRRLVLAKVANVTADKPKKILPDLLASSVQVLKSEKQLHLQRRHGSVIGLGLSCMRCRSSIFLANKRPVSVAGCSFHQDDDIEKPCQGTGDKVRVVEPGWWLFLCALVLHRPDYQTRASHKSQMTSNRSCNLKITVLLIAHGQKRRAIEIVWDQTWHSCSFGCWCQTETSTNIFNKPWSKTKLLIGSLLAFGFHALCSPAYKTKHLYLRWKTSTCTGTRCSKSKWPDINVTHLFLHGHRRVHPGFDSRLWSLDCSVVMLCEWCAHIRILCDFLHAAHDRVSPKLWKLSFPNDDATSACLLVCLGPPNAC